MKPQKMGEKHSFPVFLPPVLLACQCPIPCSATEKKIHSNTAPDLIPWLEENISQIMGKFSALTNYKVEWPPSFETGTLQM